MELHNSAEIVGGVTRAAEYSYRPPSPPHIHVPPHREDEDIILPAYALVDGESITNDDLKILTQGNHIAKPHANWRYEERREAQAILPFLYLGPSVAARNISALQKEGITMLLVIRDTVMAQAKFLSGDKVAAQLGIESTTVDVSGQQELIAAFPRAIKVINDHLISVYRKSDMRKWGKVMVFCESGNERSASVVAAYIMQMHNVELVEAIQYIQSQRFCIALNDEHKNLLYSWQQLLEARRHVSQAQTSVQQSATTHTLTPKCKRGRRDLDDEDMDMDPDRADDEARFEGRAAFKPFLS
ncbi:hypothetical protein BP5796_01350 [Coleophoma crateriformis]|uniref:Tyrosine specific protein phosphatases domain-containing protein n=1 Tax=Coleophoma crateriformis TaxID=565419 RepID=A0A3D8T077_9HELO|nr:hypothetical protein BP5796_01350 [Coleophoma crateriformis]